MNKEKMQTYFLVLIIIIIQIVYFPLSAKPQAWLKWTENNKENAKSIDHSDWDTLLKNYITDNKENGINRFDYKNVTAADNKLLNSYLENMQNLKITSYAKNEQMAYWINLYNALTIKVILEKYPLKSIKNIDGIGPWKKKRLTIEGEKISLDDIEHRILRPIWQDSRVHYAVNCASLGCPNLQNVAFTSNNLEKLLEKGAFEFINHKRGVNFKGKKLVLSSIYNWFKTDFGNNTDDLLKHLIKSAKPELKQKLQDFKGKIQYAYDWKLNE